MITRITSALAKWVKPVGKSAQGPNNEPFQEKHSGEQGKKKSSPMTLTVIEGGKDPDASPGEVSEAVPPPGASVSSIFLHIRNLLDRTLKRNGGAVMKSYNESVKVQKAAARMKKGAVLDQKAE